MGDTSSVSAINPENSISRTSFEPPNYLILQEKQRSTLNQDSTQHRLTEKLKSQSMYNPRKKSFSAAKSASTSLVAKGHTGQAYSRYQADPSFFGQSDYQRSSYQPQQVGVSPLRDAPKAGQQQNTSYSLLAQAQHKLRQSAMTKESDHLSSASVYQRLQRPSHQTAAKDYSYAQHY